MRKNSQIVEIFNAVRKTVVASDELFTLEEEIKEELSEYKSSKVILTKDKSENSSDENLG